MHPTFFYTNPPFPPATLKVKDDKESFRSRNMRHIKNPHDKFFKETFGDVLVTKDFLTHYLPVQLLQATDLNTLEPQKDSFTNENLDESFSDLLFKANIQEQEGYFFFLFEHKSYSDKSIALQLLNYMYKIWNEKANKEHNWELPIIIPIVIYHGKENWVAARSLGDMVQGFHGLPKNLQSYIPHYEYILYDLSDYTDEEIKGEAKLKIYLTICRDILTGDMDQFLYSIHRALDYLLEIEEKNTRMVYLKILMTYIFSAGRNLTQNDVKQVMKKIPEGREIMMTLAERYREEGKEEGKMEGKIEVTKKLIKKGLPTKEIIEITGFNLQEVEKIQKEMEL